MRETIKLEAGVATLAALRRLVNDNKPHPADAELLQWNLRLPNGTDATIKLVHEGR